MWSKEEEGEYAFREWGERKKEGWAKLHEVQGRGKKRVDGRGYIKGAGDAYQQVLNMR